MQRLLPEPLVTVNAPPCVDVSLRRSGEKLLIHLSNMAGMQTTPQYAVIDFIPPIGPVELTVCLDKKPREVLLEPGDQEITSNWSDGKLRVVLPQLNIHNVVVIR